MSEEEATSPAALQRECALVLVVEDETLMRKALQHWLTARNFRVSTAVDCASAIKSAVSERPQVILLDVRLLGGDDGLRLPRSLREIGIEAPFVVFTGSAGPSAGFEAHQLGAFAVIEKPALPDQIAEVLRQAANSRAATTPASGDESSGPAQLPQSDYVRRAVALIERHYAIKQFSVSKVAAEINISRDHLSRLFRLELGCSPVTYLQRTRHAHAKRLLLGSEMSVKEIADMCGYRETAEFARAFTRLVGCSPTEFRAGGNQK